MAAAAAVFQPVQLPIPEDVTSAPKPALLASSPYLDQGHLLNLDTLDPQSRLLAHALTKLHSQGTDYATVKYEDSLNLDNVLTELEKLAHTANLQWEEQDFYVVEFRSKLKPQIDNLLLFELDKESHREANISGGLLKYWYGEPDAERRNLATCFWTHKEAAIAGGRGPLHKQARAIIPQMYESINIKGLRFTVKDNVAGWTLEPYA
ncbi:uncharacterized protein HMPREF1541_10503 [Cyphellophora europaea CBS 101466]|uniref:Uncharacterized protein n=1 Tax=Cyphellophora europaea (strain CBS 101466) TaxID=1220924 RepID=W2S8E5_CYPE1|nr:uncharacterized protein HMPREF1541_10503 [Cyphellophora europaea CBS 101466]ETN44323.1 hypothetical protein HMPREF1541_10503 [Cyphellophora europaea CBS 101466]